MPDEARLREQAREAIKKFAHDGDSPGIDKYHVHVRCFAAWEFERNKFPES